MAPCRIRIPRWKGEVGTLYRQACRLSILLSLLLFHSVVAPAIALAARVEPAALAARAAALIDSQTGQILYALAGEELQFPASTTKLLTALLAVESGRLDEWVTAPADVTAGPDGTSCYLQPGEQQKFRDLVACLLVASGNDAADTIAAVVGGDRERFIEQMNRRAAELGAGNSHFANPHGLHDPMHYSTALDLARIGRAALNHPEVRSLAGLEQFTLQGPELTPRVFYNHNLLLQTYPGMVAGKTGFTEQAQYTLVALAVRDGRGLVGVVLGAPTREALFADMTSLLDWGFTALTPQPLVRAGDVAGVVPVRGGTVPEVAAVAAGEFAAWLPPGAAWSPPIQRELNLVTEVTAPVASGQPLGEIVLRQGPDVLSRIPIQARDEVPAAPSGVLQNLRRPTVLLGGAGVLLAWLAMRHLRRRRQRRWDRRRGTIRSFAPRRPLGKL